VTTIAKQNGAQRLTGLVKKWDRQRGFGFLEANGHDWFLHISEWAEEEPPRVHDAVTFRPGQDGKGRTRATQAMRA
jgi:cold shock CspA family protein